MDVSQKDLARQKWKSSAQKKAADRGRGRGRARTYRDMSTNRAGAVADDSAGDGDGDGEADEQLPSTQPDGGLDLAALLADAELVVSQASYRYSLYLTEFDDEPPALMTEDDMELSLDVQALASSLARLPLSDLLGFPLDDATDKAAKASTPTTSNAPIPITPQRPPPSAGPGPYSMHPWGTPNLSLKEEATASPSQGAATTLSAPYQPPSSAGPSLPGVIPIQPPRNEAAGASVPSQGAARAFSDPYQPPRPTGPAPQYSPLGVIPVQPPGMEAVRGSVPAQEMARAASVPNQLPPAGPAPPLSTPQAAPTSPPKEEDSIESELNKLLGLCCLRPDTSASAHHPSRSATTDGGKNSKTTAPRAASADVHQPLLGTLHASSGSVVGNAPKSKVLAHQVPASTNIHQQHPSISAASSTFYTVSAQLQSPSGVMPVPSSLNATDQGGAGGVLRLATGIPVKQDSSKVTLGSVNAMSLATQSINQSMLHSEQPMLQSASKTTNTSATASTAAVAASTSATGLKTVGNSGYSSGATIGPAISLAPPTAVHIPSSFSPLTGLGPSVPSSSSVSATSTNIHTPIASVSAGVSSIHSISLSSTAGGISTGPAKLGTQQPVGEPNVSKDKPMAQGSNVSPDKPLNNSTAAKSLEDWLDSL